MWWRNNCSPKALSRGYWTPPCRKTYVSGGIHLRRVLENLNLECWQKHKHCGICSGLLCQKIRGPSHRPYDKLKLQQTLPHVFSFCMATHIPPSGPFDSVMDVHAMTCDRCKKLWKYLSDFLVLHSIMFCINLLCVLTEQFQWENSDYLT